ncbi:hypothetical protein BKG77_07220 [Mycobacteroides chelonae]|nr:hypothetical protein BKG77_07220 [Mycobacteroides chelonae]
MHMFPGLKNPTRQDRLGAELADEQLKLVFELRKVRVRRGLNVAQVAEAMGVDAAQVSRFESGSTNPTMSTIRRYAKAVEAIFHVDVHNWDEERTERIQSRSMALWTTPDSDAEESGPMTWNPVISAKIVANR